MKVSRWFPVVALLSVAALLSGCGMAGASSSSGKSGGGLAITTAALPDGTVSQGYTGTLQAAGGTTPYEWSLTGGALPTGLSLTTAGQITGTPTLTGDYTFQTQVTDATKQSSSTNFSIKVTGPPPSIYGITPTSGSTSGGTSVTISGKNMQSGATVTFGGVAGTSVNVTSSSQMTAVTPPHAAGSVDVVVTNPGGRFATLAAAFGYGSAPPSVSAISPTSGPTTGGTAVNITGANFVLGAVVLFGSAQASSVVVTNPTQIQAVSPAGSAGSVDVIVKNPDGQTATLSGGFSYTSPATGAPAISSLSPNSGPDGTQTVVNGSNFISGATVSFGGTAASSVQFVSSSQLSVVVPSIPTGTVDVTVNDPGGATTTMASGFTVTTAQSLLSRCTVGANNQASCPTPPGWTLVQAESFDSGSLANPSNETFGGNASIECTFAHTGGCAMTMFYGSDAAYASLILPKGVIGSSHEVYVSWWEYDTTPMRENISANNYRAQFTLQNSSSSYTNVRFDIWGQLNDSSNPNACLNGVGPGNDYNCENGNEVIETVSPGQNGMDHYGATTTDITGSWVQYEIHYQANTVTGGVGNSDGSAQLYINGQLITNYTNTNMNYSQDMTGMQIAIGTYYETWKRLDSTGTICVIPNSPQMASSADCWGTSCSPCPTMNNFQKYWDDIIVLKK